MTDTGGRKGLVGAAITVVISLLAAVGLYSTTTTDSYGSWNPDRAYEISATRTPRWTHTLPVATGYSVPKTMPSVLEAAQNQLEKHKGDGYRMKRSDGTFGAALNLHTVMSRLPEKLANLPYSDVKWVVKCLVDGHLMKFHKVDINPAKMYDTQGVYAIDMIIGTVIQRYPLVRNAGICVCKRISGTYTWSQHAYCNAVDFTGPSQAYLDGVASYIRQLDSQGYLPVSLVLWRVPDHYYHVHAQGSPVSPNGLLAC